MPAPTTSLPPQSATAAHQSARGSASHQPSSEIVRLAAGDARGLGLSRLGTDCLQRIVTTPDRLLASPLVWLKQAADRRVALISADEDASETVWCCKETLSNRPWVRLISQLSSLRAWNAFRQGLLFCRLGISTPQPLAVIGVTRRGVRHEYLLTEAVDRATSLQQWLVAESSGAKRSAFSDRCHHLAQQLGAELRRLHQHRFDHRDLKATNILVSDDDRVWVVDLDGVRRWPWLPRFRRVQNLARLWVGVATTGHVPPTEALRFLFVYLSFNERANWKRWWRDVARRVDRKLKQLQRKTARSTLDLTSTATVPGFLYSGDQNELSSPT